MTTILIALLVWAQSAAAPAAAAQAPDEYLIGPRDVISITIFQEPELSREALTVDAEGTVDCPLIGRMKVADLTARQVEDLLLKAYAPRYLKSPSISVMVREFRNMTVWVSGAVRTPSQVELKGDFSLLAALNAAGNMTSEAGSYVLVIGAEEGADASGPTLPDSQKRQSQLRVSRAEIEQGRATNIRLRAGDTVYVPPAETFIITGQVRTPDRYTLSEGLNVLQAIALAGGATERAAQNRIEIHRVVDGKVAKIRVKLTDLVQANDTIVVPSRRM
jgi:polysaccharide export outer membrane protein